MRPDATADEPLVDGVALTRHLQESGIELEGPLTIELIAGGRSNLTFRLSDGVSRWVLRRPPLGHVLATAHDVRREFVVLRALEPTAVPTPRTVHLCQDPDVIGAQFMLMEFVDGSVITDRRAATSLTASEARLASETLIDSLAELHALDPAEVGLSRLGRPAGFLRRQIRLWQRQWAASADFPSPELDKLAAILEANVPARSQTALLHGDYRLGNLILAPRDPGRIAAVIDWEMSTLGDPLADLGLLLAYWNPASTGVTAGGHSISGNQGFLTADALIDRYSRHFELDRSELVFYRVFGLFKLAVIAQTIVARHLKGQAIGDELPRVASAVDTLIAAGLASAYDALVR